MDPFRDLVTVIEVTYLKDDLGPPAGDLCLLQWRRLKGRTCGDVVRLVKCLTHYGVLYGLLLYGLLFCNNPSRWVKIYHLG